MSILFLITFAILALSAGYFIYGRLLSRFLKLDKNYITPAHRFNDNVDFVPANKFYLLGQHFSAIAAAGPIVGPILAGLWFGWIPTTLWIILGGIFVGGVHDITSLVASIRHEGKSIAEIIRTNVNKRAYTIFLLFLWFSLMYIITTFADVTASTFAEPTRGAGVASSSMMYLGLALFMGIALKVFKMPLSLSTAIFIPLVFVCIYLGPVFPLSIPSIFGMDVKTSWDILLLFYCFIASVIPVWLVLQPRGYLGGFFLTLMAGLSLLGIFTGSFTPGALNIHYPAFTGWHNQAGLPILPLLFTTVACGACSGFHAIVSAGTTSKQISKETDAKLIGYGGLLLESMVAIIALGTLVVLSKADAQNLKEPNLIFASGIANFLSFVGINKELALNFALLAFATFVYDTLDVATRLGRYVFQELTGIRGRFSAYAAAIITLILPLVFVTQKIRSASGEIIPAWKIFWPVFGSSNQLLAAIVLMGISVWLYKKGMRYLYALIPSIFMMIVAILSLFFISSPWLYAALSGDFSADPVAITGILLLCLAVFLIYESARAFFGKKKTLKVFELIYAKIVKADDSPARLASGFGLGVFCGIIPGAGPVASLFLAALFRANKAMALIGSMITNTWMSVAMFSLSIFLGSRLSGVEIEALKSEWANLTAHFSFDNLFNPAFLKVAFAVLTGYLIISILAGLLSYLLMYVFIKIKRRR